MPTRFVRSVILAFVVLAAASAFAGDLADFNASVENAASHSRAAIGYLRGGDAGRATVELAQLRAAWQSMSERFADKRPDAFDGNPLYGQTMVDISIRLVAADLMLKTGRPEAAIQSLNAIRGDLYKMRMASGVFVLADCVYEANTAATEIMQYDKPDLDWTKSGTRFGIANKASIYGYVLDRCDSIASATVHNSPEFRKLVDGARAGLALIPKAIGTRDTNLLHRILIELRSFDNLLAIRFG